MMKTLILGLASTVMLTAEWKAGVAKVLITPREPIMMAGYGDRNRPHESVIQDLYAKALALDDGGGKVSVIVTLDLVGIPRNVADPIVERASSKYGLARDRLLLNTSHTHSGPIVGYRERTSYDLTDQQEVVVKRYTSRFVEQITELIGRAIQDMSPATLAFNQGLAGFAVNRRRVQLRHLPGPVDHDVPVLSIRDGGGRLRAVLFGYACHATVLNEYSINGDWPGWAQEEIEKGNPGAMALFVAGAGADQNPLPRRSVELAKTYGRVMAAAVGQVLAAKMKPVASPLVTSFELVDVPFDAHPSRAQWEARLKDPSPPIRRHAQAMLRIIERDGKLADRYPYPVQVWRFGKDLKLVALGGEVVVDYALRIKAQHGWDDTWVAAYSNDVFAYIPSLRVLKEGGYEGGGAMIPYGQPGPFAPAVEEIIIHKVDQLLNRTAP